MLYTSDIIKSFWKWLFGKQENIFAARNHGSGMVKSNIQGKSKDFDESVFLKLDVTYTESGAPIVDDINASV